MFLYLCAFVASGATERRQYQLISAMVNDKVIIVTNILIVGVK
jgi:hypothetical protein